MIVIAAKKDYCGTKTIGFTLTFIQLSKRLKHTELDLNYVELILCE